MHANAAAPLLQGGSAAPALAPSQSGIGRPALPISSAANHPILGHKAGGGLQTPGSTMAANTLVPFSPGKVAQDSRAADEEEMARLRAAAGSGSRVRPRRRRLAFRPAARMHLDSWEATIDPSQPGDPLWHMLARDCARSASHTLPALPALPPPGGRRQARGPCRAGNRGGSGAACRAGCGRCAAVSTGLQPFLQGCAHGAALSPLAGALNTESPHAWAHACALCRPPAAGPRRGALLWRATICWKTRTTHGATACRSAPRRHVPACPWPVAAPL